MVTLQGEVEVEGVNCVSIDFSWPDFTASHSSACLINPLRSSSICKHSTGQNFERRVDVPFVWSFFVYILIAANTLNPKNDSVHQNEVATLHLPLFFQVTLHFSVELVHEGRRATHRPTIQVHCQVFSASAK